MFCITIGSIIFTNVIVNLEGYNKDVKYWWLIDYKPAVKFIDLNS